MGMGGSKLSSQQSDGNKCENNVRELHPEFFCGEKALGDIDAGKHGFIQSNLSEVKMKSF